MAIDRPHQHLYNNARWRKERVVFLNEHPLCVYCGQVGKTTAATLVDHIKPHDGDEELFWDQSNWQSLCNYCHDSVKRQEEARGYAVGCDSDGMPLDKNHKWNEV